MKRSGLLLALVCNAILGPFFCAATIALLYGLILLVTGRLSAGRTLLDTILMWFGCTLGAATSLWISYRAILHTYLCIRDLRHPPTMLIGPVSSKYETTNDVGEATHYLVMGTETFEVNAAQYKAISSGDVSALSYWPNSRTVASAERYTGPATWPTEVVRLAEAARAGADCLFALHDALLEAGYPELAEHCHDGRSAAWVIDLILNERMAT
jgi:hypothetical protein